MREMIKRIYNDSYSNYLLYLNDVIATNRKLFIVTANSEILMMSENNPEIKEILSQQDISIVPDGIAVVKAGKILGYHIQERITGIDLSWELLKKADQNKMKLFLFGGSKKTIDDCQKVIARNYPNIILLGAIDGYVADKDKVFEDILRLQPDICLIGMGVPMQEKLIYKHIDKFSKGIFIGVGGSLDVISGNKKRAPKIFINLNLEWLYRLVSEPSRIKRFYNNNIKFINSVYKESKGNYK